MTDKVVDPSAVVALLFNARALNAELVTLDHKLARADRVLRRASERASGHSTA